MFTQKLQFFKGINGKFSDQLLLPYNFFFYSSGMPRMHLFIFASVVVFIFETEYLCLNAAFTARVAFIYSVNTVVESVSYSLVRALVTVMQSQR